MLVTLGLLALAMQGQLWLSPDGFRKTRDLRAAVAAQRVLNEELRQRNRALDAEVINLKGRSEAAEERARTDLGMIGRNETFYHVVSAADASR